MIIYENKGFEINSNHPDTDWTGKALYVVPNGSPLADKIKSLYPHYDFITDNDGKLIDVIETEHDEQICEPEPTATEILNTLLGV